MKLSMSQSTTKEDKINNFFRIRNVFNFITKINVTRRNEQNTIVVESAYL